MNKKYKNKLRKKEMKMSKNGTKGTRKSNPIIVDLIASTITVSKSFYKKASMYGSDEYHMLKTVLNEQPNADWKIVFKEIKNSTKRKTYKNLTLENMEKYILLKEKEGSPKVAEFRKVIEASDIQPSPFAAIRKWFIENYSGYDDFDTLGTTEEDKQDGKADLKIVDKDTKKGRATK